MFIWTWWSSKVTTCPSELQLAVFLTVGPSGPGPGRLSVLAATCHFTHNERSDSSVHRKKGACNQCVFQPFLLVQVWPPLEHTPVFPSRCSCVTTYYLSMNQFLKWNTPAFCCFVYHKFLMNSVLWLCLKLNYSMCSVATATELSWSL